MVDEYENITKTANTLWNNDESGQIAYAEQVKDAAINWDAVDPNQAGEGEPDKYKLPAMFMNNAFRNNPQFQTLLNEFFLKHYVEFHNFLEEEDLDPSTINTWKELEKFLIGISDSEAFTLLSLIESMEQQAGHLTVGMDEVINTPNGIPGLMVAVSTSDVVTMENSYIDEQTGIIKIVYNIN